MNILFIKHYLNIFVYNLWFLRYRECPYSGTARIRLFSLTSYYHTFVIRSFSDPRLRTRSRSRSGSDRRSLNDRDPAHH